MRTKSGKKRNEIKYRETKLKEKQTKKMIKKTTIKRMSTIFDIITKQNQWKWRKNPKQRKSN